MSATHPPYVSLDTGSSGTVHQQYEHTLQAQPRGVESKTIVMLTTMTLPYFESDTPLIVASLLPETRDYQAKMRPTATTFSGSESDSTEAEFQNSRCTPAPRACIEQSSHCCKPFTGSMRSIMTSGSAFNEAGGR